MAGLFDWLPTAISVGGTLWGASKAADATKEAAKTSAAATQAGTDAQVKALNEARQTMLEQQTAASPGLMAVQNIIGRGEALTPVQQTELDNATRTTLDALQGGSVRGSARATADTVKQVRGDMTDAYIQSNRNRVDQAAQNLSGQYFNAGTNAAKLTSDTGQAISNGLMTTGATNAAAGIGQATIQGKAIGDIGAVIAGQLKDDALKKRESSYTKVS